ncbi:hypothetical protein A6V39_01025 [Candidatus Mycoplasma haematobovis]|uniref:Uncharacterized protein n=1 Tax=Candidatus Mycoplasma haematobovis TaxID=432608 RepID=A0A1A9QF92_9MOLU|nr:hypothetical protein [Candidatus Mycoplasma haematobovis]OAL10635.1 hypothetical protein A6V39_01025 [Candidatus Mycoplasma haematobovis]
MSFLSHLNFVATLATFGCISFAASNFGVKLGKVVSRQNTLGFKYISDSTHSDKLYDAIVKVNSSLNNVPSWAKDKEQLKKWCSSYQTSTRYWKDASQYCLIRNNVWHKLIENNIELKEIPEIGTNNDCNYELLNAYSDGENSLSYLIGKQKCSKPKK